MSLCDLVKFNGLCKCGCDSFALKMRGIDHNKLLSNGCIHSAMWVSDKRKPDLDNQSEKC